MLTATLAITQTHSPQGEPDRAGLMAGTELGVVSLVIPVVFAGRRVMQSSSAGCGSGAGREVERAAAPRAKVEEPLEAGRGAERAPRQ